jgi:probable rRNA maturation factor
MPVCVDIAVADDGWHDNADPEPLIRAAADAVLVRAPGVTGDYEVSVLLADDAAVHALNRQWRGKDKPTNILSFPAARVPGLPDGEARFLGDLVLARETVEREAGERGIAIADHLTHLTVHGMLHLLGYDHLTDTEAEAMEGLETAILASLGIDDPYRVYSDEDAPASAPAEQV